MQVMDMQPFHSDVRIPEHPDWRAAAVYCSDGRFTPACEQFLDYQFGDSCVDRLVVPGGPAAMVHNADGEGRVAELSFLVEAHQLSRAILIAHEACGYYQHTFGLEPAAMADKQREDLEYAADLLKQRMPDLAGDCYRAEVEAEQVVIRPLTLSR
jgi:carbonic anhydrase